MRLWVVVCVVWTIGWWGFMGFIVYDRGYDEFSINLRTVFAVWLVPTVGVPVLYLMVVRVSRWVIQGFQLRRRPRRSPRKR